MGHATHDVTRAPAGAGWAGVLPGQEMFPLAGPTAKKCCATPAARAYCADNYRRHPMTLCPIAIAVGCAKCPAFSVCPLKTVIGDQPKAEDKPAAPARKD
jgi:hypothetical protein